MQDLQKRVRDINLTHGWGEEYGRIRHIDTVAILTSNLHGEVSELWEAARKGCLDEVSDKFLSGVMDPLTNGEEEIADIIIRALDTAHWLSVDAYKATVRKLEYNDTRPFRHGMKLA